MPGTVIKRYREMKNFSQKFVAAKMGISQNAYSKIENNITQLTVQHIKQLSTILDVPITNLLKDDFEIHKPMAVMHGVTRSDLLKQVEKLYKKIESKQAERHHCYIVAMSLATTAEGAIDAAH